VKKLRKKILPVLLVLFTLSNIGVPLSLHFCKSMHKISLESCGMCKNNLTTNHAAISRIKNCCENHVVAKPINDEYLTQKSNLNDVRISDIISFIFPGKYESFNYANLNSELKENSPPGVFNTPDYISNLQLLI
jgi:hypothetical protein